MRKTNLALTLILTLSIAACKGPLSPEESYDQATHQSPITTHAQIDSVLDNLKAQPFAKLDPTYLSAAGIKGEWKRTLSKKQWYLIRGEEAYQYIVGKFRIDEFLPHDSLYQLQKAQPLPAQRHYLCIDRRVLHKLLDLLTAMTEKGLDPNQIAIKHGFRNPTYNTQIGGASKSRHQWGEAIDLYVSDVNHDGLQDANDKAPLLALLDTKIIANQGGVGKYPGSNVIHMDVRGFRARWDEQ